MPSDYEILEPERETEADYELLEPEQPQAQAGLTIPTELLSESARSVPSTQEVTRGGAPLSLSAPASFPEISEVASNIGGAITFAGDVARSIPADFSAGMSLFKRPEGQPPTLFPSPTAIRSAVRQNLPAAAAASGNIPAAISNQPMPIDATIQAAAEEAKLRGEGSGVATTAHLSQGLAATAPLIAGIGVIPAGMRFLVSAGFSADMIRKAPELFNRYAEEINKPEADQDPNAIAELQSGIIQTFGFAPAAGAHGVSGARTAARPIIDRLNLARENAAKLKQTEVKDAVQSKTETVLRDVREPEVTQEGAKPLPAEESGAKANETLTPEVKSEAMELARKIPEMTGEQFRQQARGFNRMNLELGLKATPDQITELTKLRDKAVERQKASLDQAMKSREEASQPGASEEVAKRAEKELQEAMDIAQTPQFYNEAIGMAELVRDSPIVYDGKVGNRMQFTITENGKKTGGTFTVPETATAGDVRAALAKKIEEFSAAPTSEEARILAELEAQPEPAMAGPGGTVASDIGVSTSELTQLAKSTPKVSGTAKSEIGKSAGELLKGAAASTKTLAKNVKDFLVGEPKWDSYMDALGKWQGIRQESARDAYLAWKDFKKQMPDQNRRAAIGAWADAGGDRAVMEKAAAELPAKYADIYKQALKLSPEEITFAKNIRGYFDKRLQDAQDAGILEHGLENYIRRIYEKDPELATAYSAELQRLSTATPDFARQRFYEYDADAIKAGKKPIQDFAARVLEYDQALNHAIADRAFVKSMMRLKMPDGRPRIDVGGSGKLLPEGEVPKEAMLVKPQFKPNSDAPLDNRSDYRPFNHPAFRKYKWISKDPAGRDVYVQGDVLVHPDAYPQMQKLLEASKIRQHPIGRGALKVSSTIKQTMLDLSLFHPVQIGVHGMEHRVMPTRLKEIDLKDPQQKALVEHGLIVAEDRGFYDWSEGLHGTSLTRHIPKIGPKLQDFHDWMFKEWIPTIKMNMAEHALERNRARYPKLTKDQLMKLTAEQANAAFGGLNYRMLGRSQTMQDFLRLTFLAPDFLEARGRFAGQALKGYGKEQLTALMLGAATLYVTARIMNQMLNGNPHWEKENAFSVIYNDHAYGLRTVQGDLLHLMAKPGQFWYHRLNPTTTRPLMEVISGRDYFGRQVGIGDVLMDEVKTIVPISLRGLTEGKEQSVFESALNAMGITTRRYNAITQAYDLARKWREESKTRPEPGEFIYDPEKDPLRNLKVSLQHEHTPDSVKEITDLIRSGGYTEAQLKQHFQRYANDPIAGSTKDQKKFMASLRPDQQEIVRLAQERKKKTYDDFKAALALYRQQVKSAASGLSPAPTVPGPSR